MMKKGSFVISLDFEMMWGCHDWSTPDKYGKSNVSNVRTVISRLLELFQKYDVHATFATVGLIFCSNKADVELHKPNLIPSYIDANRSPYKEGYIASIKNVEESLYYAPDVIKQLQSYNNIEIGSHTFCHYFCWEEGQTLEQFEADINKAQLVANEKGIQLESIVFPRNQVSDDYLSVCAKYGIETYRGNPRKFFDETHSNLKSIYYKVARLLDAYVNWGGYTSHPYDTIDVNHIPVNVPASRMLRPYMSKLRWLEGLRLRRIKKEMQYAAKHHELYHLWWHPHNFGADMEENFSFLEKVLKCYQSCHEQYGMVSMTMKEFYSIIKDNIHN